MSDLNFTPIYEKARAQFGITRDEYALCNYVQTWSAHPGNKFPGWCDRTQSQIAAWLGKSDRGVRKMVIRLVEFDLLEQNQTSRLLRVTALWFDTVNTARKEQSSGTHAEQSSGQGRNKVPTKAEQSSGQGRNKVPTHSKYNSKDNSKSNSKIGAKAPQRKPSDSKPKKEKAPPQVAADPSPVEYKPNLTYQMREVFERHYEQLFNDDLFDWQQKEWKGLKHLGGKLRARLEKKGGPADDESLLRSFDQFLTLAAKADSWTVTNGFTPSRLNGQYQAIIQKIIAKNTTTDEKRKFAFGPDSIKRAQRTAQRIAEDIASGKGI